MAKFKPAAYCSECGAEATPERGLGGPQVIRHRLACPALGTREVLDRDVLQTGPLGPRLVGRLHQQPSGRWHVIMCGRRVAMRLRTRAAAVAVAMAWQPTDPDDAELLAQVLDHRLRRDKEPSQ